MSDVETKVKSAWDKFLAAVKSSPATFAYGVVIGVIIGAILW